MFEKSYVPLHGGGGVKNCQNHSYVINEWPLTIMLARGSREKGSGGRVRLTDANTRRLSGLKYKLVCHFKLAADMVMEFCKMRKTPAILERDLMRFGMDGYQ